MNGNDIRHQVRSSVTRALLLAITIMTAVFAASSQPVNQPANTPPVNSHPANSEPKIEFAVTSMSQISCTTGGGSFRVIFEATEPTQVCVLLVPGAKCQAILRSLDDNRVQVVAEGDPKVACITAKRAAVICAGETQGEKCSYQITSIAGVPNFSFTITLMLLITLALAIGIILLIWRAFGPFFRPREQ